MDSRDDGSCVCGHEVRREDIAALQNGVEDAGDGPDLEAIVPEAGIETGDDGEPVWRCYRRTNGDDDRCLFHMDPDVRRERYGLSDGELAQVLLAVINDDIGAVLRDDDGGGGYLPDETPAGREPLEVVRDGDEGVDDSPDTVKRRRLEFVGANFGDLNLSYERLSPPSSYNISLAGIDARTVDLSLATVENLLNLAGASLDELNCRQTDTSGIYAKWLDVDGELSLPGADTGFVRFDHARIRGNFHAKGIVSSDNLWFDDARIEGDATLKDLDVRGNVRIYDARIEGDVSLYSAAVDGYVHLKDGTKVGGTVDVQFVDADELSFTDADLRRGITGDKIRTERGVWMKRTTVDGNVSLTQGRIGTKVSMTELEVSAREGTEDGNGGIDGNVTLNKLQTGQGVTFGGATIDGDASLRRLNAGSNVSIKQAHIDGDLSLYSADVEGYIHIKDGTTVGGAVDVQFVDAGELSLNGTDVGTDIDGDNIRTERGVWLRRATVSGDLSLTGARVGTKLSMNGLEVTGRDGGEDDDGADGDLLLESLHARDCFGRGMDVRGTLDFSNVLIREGVDFRPGDSPTVIGEGADFAASEVDVLFLSGARIGGDLEMTLIEIRWALGLDDVRVTGGIALRFSSIEGGISAEGATVGDGFDLTKVDVEKELTLNEIDVGRDLNLTNADVGTRVYLSDATVDGEVSFDGARLEEGVSLFRAVVEDGIELDEATVRGTVRFGSGTFVGDDVSLSSMDADDDVRFHGAVVSGTILVDGNAVLDDLVLADGARFARLAACNVRVRGTLRLRTCLSLPVSGGGVYVSDGEFGRVSIDVPDDAPGVPVIGGPLLLQDSAVEDRLEVLCDPFVHPAVRAVSLAGSRVPEATLSLGDHDGAQVVPVAAERSGGVALGVRARSNDIVYDLSEATIGEFDPADEESCDQHPYYHFRFWTTEFDRFRFGEHRADFERTDWSIHELRRWGDQDIAAVTEPGRGIRSKPDAATGLPDALSPHFVEAHEREASETRIPTAAEADRADSPLERLSALSVDVPALSSGDTDESTREWSTDATTGERPDEYDGDERTVLDRSGRDHSGEVIAAIRRLRVRIDRVPRSGNTDDLTRLALEACLSAVRDGSRSGSSLVDRISDRNLDDDGDAREHIVEYLLAKTSTTEDSEAHEIVVGIAEEAMSLVRRLETAGTDGDEGPDDTLLFRMIHAFLEDFESARENGRGLDWMLGVWNYTPEARVRNDTWNAATVSAFERATERIENRDDRRLLQQLEGTYTLAKKAAADVGENTAASKFHYSERLYGLELHELDGRTRARLGNSVLRWLTGYGERPQNVILWSFGVIAVWTGLYWVAQQSLDVLPGASLLDLLVFSIGSFATLLPTSPLDSGPDGVPETAATVVQLLSETEAVLGVFMVAVFVFTLTRSLQR